MPLSAIKRTTPLQLFVFWLLLCHLSAKAQSPKKQNVDSQTIDLSGNWNFQMDSSDRGVTQQWYKHNLGGKIKLPGSLTTNGIGDDISVKTPWTGSIEDSSWFHAPQYAQYRKPGNIKIPFWLQPVKYYKGAAWYSKNITIPASWKGKHIELYIERSHWETILWVDDKLAGMQNSLATAHVYDLTDLLNSGHHRITIRVDNRIKDIDVGENSHSITDHTQGNWNGMIGKMYLTARPPIYIDDVQLYPDIKNKQVTARIHLKNSSGKIAGAELRLLAIAAGTGLQETAPVLKTLRMGKDTLIQVVYPMGSHPKLWSEFHPDIYKMSVSVSAKTGGVDQKLVTFGMREFKTRGTQFIINGQLTMLRGTLECAVFPKTGYPPTDVASWLHVMSVCKSYGLNHIRFHSWCPPDAAFEAADRLGLYLHIECCSWANFNVTIGDGKPIDQYLYDESRRIVKAYGNHPSFCMMAYGNEPAGKNLENYLRNFVKYWQKTDPRRLYTTASGWPIIDEADYNSTPAPRIQQWGQGLKSIINSKLPATNYDWRDTIKSFKHPTVSHEIGQWCVYPDFKEIPKYTGILKAKNFEIFRDQLQNNHLGHLANDFVYASGKLQALCYKAEIEAALRTPNFGGFQLLGLSDFPGQGTALVGVVNPFWEDKGYINAQQFSRFCGPVVPLARLPKMIYLDNETLSATVEIAQFGPSALHNVTPVWSISDSQDKVLFAGKLAKTDISIGNGIPLGLIKQPLSTISKPSKLTLMVDVAGHKNTWDFFVYPAVLPKIDAGILVTQTLDAKAIEMLNKGGKVLLTLKKGTLRDNKGGDIAIGFSSIFWNTAWTNKQPPVTMGILCDPKHPALKDFPTQAYSNWQWWDAMSHSNAIILDSVAPNLHPIVRVIDDWFTARSLGLIFECKVGKGSLIVSGIDLLNGAENRPEARQLRYSLEHYMTTPAFAPANAVELKKIISLYK